MPLDLRVVLVLENLDEAAFRRDDPRPFTSFGEVDLRLLVLDNPRAHRVRLLVQLQVCGDERQSLYRLVLLKVFAFLQRAVLRAHVVKVLLHILVVEEELFFPHFQTDHIVLSYASAQFRCWNPPRCCVFAFCLHCVHVNTLYRFLNLR